MTADFSTGEKVAKMMDEARRITDDVFKKLADIIEDPYVEDVGVKIKAIGGVLGFTLPHTPPVQMPIHLRAWVKKQNLLMSVDGVDWKDGEISRAHNSELDRHPTVPELAIVMLGSGLPDKDGTEIFAGDLVKYVNRLMNSPLVFHVVLSEGSFVARRSGISHYLRDISGEGGCKIVGCIQAHPNMMEVSA